MSKEICEEAAMNGHLECLRFLRDNGCPWNAKKLLQNVKHEEILMYVKEKSKSGSKKRVLVRAISNPSLSLTGFGSNLNLDGFLNLNQN